MLINYAATDAQQKCKVITQAVHFGFFPAERVRISHVLSDLLRLRCPGFLAIPVTAGTVSLPSVDGSIARLLFHDFAAVETVLVVCFLFVG